MMQNRRQGFTLAELLIVVVIVAVLAGIGIPSYRRVVERGYWRGAQDILMTIYAGEQIYRTQKNTYVEPAGGCGALGPWRCVYMDNPNDPNIPVAFTVGGVGANNFTAKATRQAGVFMTIDENRNLNLAAWPQP